MTRDEEFMTLALEEAKKAIGEGEVPVGAVLVHGGKSWRGGTICASPFAIPRPMRKWSSYGKQLEN